MTCELQLNMLNYHEGSAQATSKIFGILVTLILRHVHVSNAVVDSLNHFTNVQIIYHV